MSSNLRQDKATRAEEGAKEQTIFNLRIKTARYRSALRRHEAEIEYCLFRSDLTKPELALSCRILLVI